MINKACGTVLEYIHFVDYALNQVLNQIELLLYCL